MARDFSAEILNPNSSHFSLMRCLMKAQEATVVLHTDSRAVLQVLHQRHPNNTVGLVTAILGSRQSLAAQGRRAKLNWIPAMWASRATRPPTQPPGEPRVAPGDTARPLSAGDR